MIPSAISSLVFWTRRHSSFMGFSTGLNERLAARQLRVWHQSDKIMTLACDLAVMTADAQVEPPIKLPFRKAKGEV
jgi:hypothetical protein